MTRNKRVCPVEQSGGFDSRLRALIQNPRKILNSYVEEGMTVLDLGCGPGFFTVPMAEMVGHRGRVIAADLQKGMLHKLEQKIGGTDIEERVKLHKCQETSIGVTDKVDFILAFYMVHEVPRLYSFFEELREILKPKGKLYVVEPLFHASSKEFAETIEIAKKAGLKEIERPRLLLSRAVVFA